MKVFGARVRGLSPLMVHSDQGTDPLCDLAKEIKALTGKRKKTDADHEEIAFLEWWGAFYINGDGAPVIPENCIRAMIRDGARLRKRGMDVERGLGFFGVDPEVEVGFRFGNLADRDEARKVFENRRFVDRRPVVVQRAKIWRTRPVFPQWGLSFNLVVDEDVINGSDIRTSLEQAGSMIGLCGGRRIGMGRFEVVEFGQAR